MVPRTGKVRVREIEKDGKLADRTVQKGPVEERVVVFVVHRRMGQNEVTDRRVKRGKEARQMRCG